MNTAAADTSLLTADVGSSSSASTSAVALPVLPGNDPKRFKAANPDDNTRFNAAKSAGEMKEVFMSMMTAQQDSFNQIMRDQQHQQQKMMEWMMKMQEKPAVVAPQPQQQAAPTTPAVPPGLEAPTPVVASQGTDEAKKKVQKEFDELLSKEKMKFTKKVKTFLRSKDTLAKRQKDAKLMKEDTSLTKFPEPMKPYKPPPTEVELDEAWSKSKEEDFQLKLTFQKGTTMRRALELVYWYAVRQQKEIYEEAAVEKVKTMETASRKQAFVEACKLTVQNAQATSDAEALGLDGPQRVILGEAELTAKIEKLYTDVFDAAIKAKKEDEKKTEEKEKDKEEVDKELEALQPLAVMEDFLEAQTRDHDVQMEEDGGAEATVPAQNPGAASSEVVLGKFKTMVSDLKTNLKPLIPKNDHGGSVAPPTQKAGAPCPDLRVRKPKSKAAKAKAKGKGKQNQTLDQWQTQWHGQQNQQKGKGKGKGGGKGKKGEKAGGKNGAGKGRTLQY